MRSQRAQTGPSRAETTSMIAWCAMLRKAAETEV